MNMNILEHKDFIRYKQPVEFKGFRAIGYFPYERARVKATWDGARPPRHLYYEIESTIQRNVVMDNKIVVLFEDTTNFGTTDFAIFFHDLSAVIGRWEDVCSYTGEELK